jgi:hypothetical protein
LAQFPRRQNVTPDDSLPFQGRASKGKLKKRSLVPTLSEEDSDIKEPNICYDSEDNDTEATPENALLVTTSERISCGIWVRENAVGESFLVVICVTFALGCHRFQKLGPLYVQLKCQRLTLFSLQSTSWLVCDLHYVYQ